MYLWFQVPIFLLASVLVVQGQPISFSDQIYPLFEKAGCRNCHNPEGVAAPTRLRFPDREAPKVRIEAFGKSLVELVDKQNPDNSILLLKPTNRIPHSGGERIAKNSPEEATLKSWIGILVNLAGPELAAALRYNQEEAAGRGLVPQVVLRRLTHSQYNNTVRDLLKDTTNPAKQFPPEDYVNGFKNQYQALAVSPLLAEAYSLAAERIVANAFRRGDSHGLIPCTPSSDEDVACRTEFITTFGRKAFRRPLDPEEVERYQAIFKTQKKFLEGVEAVIEAMLQSPNFVFWLEDTPNPKWKPYATAARLAYFLWNTTPDEALLDSAARGELDTPEGVEHVVRSMIDSPKAKAGLDEFVSQWLRFDRVMNAARERRLYPLFSRELAMAMTEEARRFIGDLVWNDRDFMQVFTANYSFINSDLAAVYKVDPPVHDFERVELPPDSERAGLLGQALFLTLTSKPEDTAPTGRGLFIREQFLCQKVPNPPPGVDTSLPPVEESRPVTNRERMAAHTNNATCATCHHLIDPIGFGLEKFDAIGMRREKHKLLFYPVLEDMVAARTAKPKVVELDLDTSGVVAGLDDSRFTSPRQLGELFARTPQCQECVVKQVFRYMAGRPDTPADKPLLNEALGSFRNSGFRFKELLVSLAKGQDVFSARRRIHVASNH
jgi:Protein of unknown function (DUF1592)/Protein of unknown function (DUF1588)/Protein of unknown function (DUF1587)/Protein of unknown function (DUF1595)/Protein of unknown function (DUF1585)